MKRTHFECWIRENTQLQREDPSLNPTAGGCVYYDGQCDDTSQLSSYHTQDREVSTSQNAVMLYGREIKARCSFHIAVFIPGNFWGEGDSPQRKTYNSPQTAAKLCALNVFFFGRDSKLQIYHGNFLLMDNKQRKLFVTKNNRNGSNLCLKCTKIHLAAWLCPDSLEELIRSPDSGGYF